MSVTQEIEHLSWLADLMGVELYDMLCGAVKTDILHDIHPVDYSAIAHFNRICKNDVKLHAIVNTKVTHG